MRTKRLTNKALLAAVDAKLSQLRNGYNHTNTLTNPQERELNQWTLGQITMLDEVRMMLLGLRRSFI